LLLTCSFVFINENTSIANPSHISPFSQRILHCVYLDVYSIRSSARLAISLSCEGVIVSLAYVNHLFYVFLGTGLITALNVNDCGLLRRN